MSQSLAKLWIHIIFSTKNREPFLENLKIREQMHAYLVQVTRDMKSPAAMVGGVADHVHLLCLQDKNAKIPDLIAKLKQTSSKWIKTKGNAFANFYWQAGYGVFSVSQSAVPAVKEYIANQATHHRHMGFKEEFRLHLERHCLDYDERYVWD